MARALEVVCATGHPLAHWQKRREGGIGGQIDLRPLILLPDRSRLYERCDRRFAAMLDNGAIPEVAALLTRQLDPDLPVMRAIGVPEIAGYLAGEWPLEAALERGSQATRRYVKRQFTWLKHQFPGDWPRIESHPYHDDMIFDVLFHSFGLT